MILAIIIEYEDNLTSGPHTASDLHCSLLKVSLGLETVLVEGDPAKLHHITPQ